MEQSVSRPDLDPRPRRWLVILDYLFYLLLLLAIVGLAYYIYYFLSTPLIVSLSGKLSMIIWIPILLQKTGITIVISLISVVLATIFGFIGALGRLSRFAPLRWLAAIYVEVIRGTPILVQLLCWYFGVAQILSAGVHFDPYALIYNLMTALQSNSLVANIDPSLFDAFFWGIIGLSFNYGAYLTEVFRAGIESVQKGQSEAALSLGLNSSQVMRRIVLPQAIRITMPPFTNNFITLVQDTALLSTIAVLELQQQMSTIADPLLDANKKLFIYILGALVYLAICYPLALLSRYLEGRMAIAY